MHILVTGGAGYIGSHTLVDLLENGYNVSVVDNLANSSAESLKQVEQITKKRVQFYRQDLRDQTALDKLFTEQAFDAVIHFAGLKAVGESVQNPLLYYQNNLGSTLTLLEVMKAHDVKTIIFSSSATVYKQDEPVPWTENTPAGTAIGNPYGRTKYMIEQMLIDLHASDPTWNAIILRYFNPVGAHPSGKIGENPNGIPNNLMPFIAQVSVGKRPELAIFGDDYDTPDGTCIRDYIHVVDLAKGHVAALKYALARPNDLVEVFNLGSGKGNSVIEVLHAFEKAAKKPIPHRFAPRRAGDTPIYYADASKALGTLNWKTEKTIDDACADVWRWQSQNPDGF
ncbi:MAG: UDP-glucose 4-epimerase GalE [Candidatus Saccharimonadales bacterium]